MGEAAEGCRAEAFHKLVGPLTREYRTGLLRSNSLHVFTSSTGVTSTIVPSKMAGWLALPSMR